MKRGLAEITHTVKVECIRCSWKAYRHNYGSRKKKMYSWSKGKNRNYSRGSSHAKVTDPCSRCGRAVKFVPILESAKVVESYLKSK